MQKYQPDDAFIATVERALKNDPIAFWKLEALTTVREDNIMQAGNWLYEKLTRLVAEQPQHDSALTLLGLLYRISWGVKQNYEEAIDCFDRAIQFNNAEAMRNRAVMCRMGCGSPPNLIMYENLNQQACELRNPNAIFDRSLGMNDVAQEIALLEEAAALNHSSAMIERANFHLLEEHGPINVTAAIDLFEKAIVLGDPNAMLGLANLYAAKTKLPANNVMNLNEASKLYRQALLAFRSEFYRQNALDELKQLVQKNPNNPQVKYNFIMAQSAEDEIVIFATTNPPLFIEALFRDELLTNEQKLTYFTDIFKEHAMELLIHSFNKPGQLFALSQFQIAIAERALQNSIQQLAVAQTALAFADDARRKLENIGEPITRGLQKQLQERFLLALCEINSTEALTDVDFFAKAIEYLRQYPKNTRANTKLIELVQVANLEPYFTSLEKQQLILAIEKSEGLLLDRLDNLAVYKRIHQEQTTTSSQRADFEEFAVRHAIIVALENALNHPSNLPAVSWISKLANTRQSSINNAMTESIATLRKSCEAANTSLAVCAQKTRDFLVQLRFDNPSIAPAATNLLEALAVALKVQDENAPKQTPTELRDQICFKLNQQVISVVLSQNQAHSS